LDTTHFIALSTPYEAVSSLLIHHAETEIWSCSFKRVCK
jgi:hypothetical protein